MKMSLSVLFSFDGQSLISGDYGGTVRQWNVQTGSSLCFWQAREGRIFTLALHPDNIRLASGGSDRFVRLWDVRTGQSLKTFQGHRAAVSAVCFATDGQHLISASFDRTIRIWDIAAEHCIQTLQGHQNVVSSVIDDTALFSSSLDESILMCNLNSGDCLRTLIAPRPYEGMNITGAIGLTEAEVATLKALGAIGN
jgi:WD40 repeat protein